MKMKKILLFFACTILLASCSNKKAQQDETATEQNEVSQVVDTHNAQNSLSYYGVYEGVLPCADCEGIKVKVTLQKDTTYLYEQEYLTTKVEETKSSFNGKFAWNEEGNKITLEGMEGQGSSQFFVAESQLFVLDTEGNKIEGELAEHYVLKQIEVVE